MTENGEIISFVEFAKGKGREILLPPLTRTGRIKLAGYGALVGAFAGVVTLGVLNLDTILTPQLNIGVPILSETLRLQLSIVKAIASRPVEVISAYTALGSAVTFAIR